MYRTTSAGRTSLAILAFPSLGGCSSSDLSRHVIVDAASEARDSQPGSPVATDAGHHVTDARRDVSNPEPLDAGSRLDSAADVSSDAGALCADLIVNRGFELPVVAAGSYVYSIDPNFLPGWTLSAGSNQFFIENGKPFAVTRHSEGAQSICLNGDGAPNVYVEQTFATSVGQKYTVSFSMSDEQVAGPSAAALLVEVGGVSKTFTRANDTGFVQKALAFRATSASTTLRFTDKTPGSSPVNNPFLDAVSVTCGGGLPILDAGGD